MNYEKHKEVVAKVKSVLEINKQYFEAFNSKLALKFNFFEFFNVDENKTSEILAFLLDSKGSHGQSDLFLNMFLEQFSLEQFSTFPNVICESVISNKRRIDILIKDSESAIAIENKIWAEDQPNQLLDYSKYLEKEFNGNYTLLYLTPYGHSPSKKSIKDQEALGDKLKIISYEHHIINYLKKCMGLCEANNVRAFIGEFIKHIETKINLNNFISMNDKIKDIINSNREEIKDIVNTYNQMERDTIQTIIEIGNDLQNHPAPSNKEISMKIVKPFKYQGKQFFKIGYCLNNEFIYVEIFQNNIDYKFKYHFAGDYSDEFVNKFKQSDMLYNKSFSYSTSKNELKTIFLNELDKAIKLL